MGHITTAPTSLMAMMSYWPIQRILSVSRLAVLVSDTPVSLIWKLGQRSHNMDAKEDECKDKIPYTERSLALLHYILVSSSDCWTPSPQNSLRLLLWSPFQARPLSSAVDRDLLASHSPFRMV